MTSVEMNADNQISHTIPLNNTQEIGLPRVLKIISHENNLLQSKLASNKYCSIKINRDCKPVKF